MFKEDLGIRIRSHTIRRSNDGMKAVRQRVSSTMYVWNVRLIFLVRIIIAQHRSSMIQTLQSLADCHYM